MASQKQVIYACLLYKFKFGSNASNGYCKICMAFGDDVIKERIAWNWFQKFASGDASLEVIPRSRKPLYLNDEDLRTEIETNLKLICREHASTFNVNEETIRSHLHQLGKIWKWTNCNGSQYAALVSVGQKPNLYLTEF